MPTWSAVWRTSSVGCGVVVGVVGKTRMRRPQDRVSEANDGWSGVGAWLNSLGSSQSKLWDFLTKSVKWSYAWHAPRLLCVPQAVRGSNRHILKKIFLLFNQHQVTDASASFRPIMRPQNSAVMTYWLMASLVTSIKCRRQAALASSVMISSPLTGSKSRVRRRVVG